MPGFAARTSHERGDKGFTTRIRRITSLGRAKRPRAGRPPAMSDRLRGYRGWPPAAAARLIIYKHMKAAAEQRPSSGRGTLTMLADMLVVARTGLFTIGAVYLVVWALGLLG